MGEPKMNPAVVDHLPAFITLPGQSDWLFNAVVVFLLIVVLAVGNLYFQLHAVPERMAHRTNKVQIEIVAVLALISLFTHNHIYWILGLLLAMIEFPDFSTPMGSIAQSLERIAGKEPEATGGDVAATGVGERTPGSSEGI
ncbi:hypothetical protein SAMN04515648_0974 [Phyllobacterium sp. CL33Tsu]|uniref:hypothetical protein n=1 Tax=Phyllobacterium sp. CL33Tsu TaxID=1798191 RepID=UPI0008ED0692|nr:hypothetical protein [Phyllobacterium sp. CL33Tsu]SFI64965.1 hypothetical protein SAMN04515648_0974 [Phyllobacterium sp. CL33Tsu]